MALPSPKQGKARQRDVIALCETAQDFYRPEGRSLIGRVSRYFLDLNILTPTELLFSQANQHKIVNTESAYRAGVSKAAELQAKTHGSETQERANKLFLLCDAVQALTTKRSNLLKSLVVKPENFAASVSWVLEDKSRDDADFIINRGLGNYLAGSPSWETKVERLLQLLEGSNAGPEDTYLDNILGESFMSQAAIKSVFMNGTLPGDALNDMLDIVLAVPRPRVEASDQIHRLHALCANRPLPQTRCGLGQAFQNLLACGTPLFPVPEADRHTMKNLSRELLALNKINKRLTVQGLPICYTTVAEILHTRTARLINLDTLLDMSKATNEPAEKAGDALNLYPLVIGGQNKETVHTFLIRLICDRDYGEKLMRAYREPMDKMAAPGYLEKRIRRTKMPSDVTEKLCETLAEIQTTHIKENRIFQRLRSLPQKETEKGTYILTLTLNGAFTKGTCLAAARKMIMMYLGHPSRWLEYANQFHDPATKSQKLAELKENMIAIGLRVPA